MEHAYFFLLSLAVFILVVLADRKKAKDYLLLALVGLLLAFVFENFTTFIGLWYYHSEPKVLLISLYTWLLYVPYLGFCYFLANRVVRHV